jgi:ATP-dependent helicase/nuclease subunit B
MRQLYDIIPLFASPENQWPDWVKETIKIPSIAQAKRQLSLIHDCVSRPFLSPEIIAALCGNCHAIPATQLEWFAECPFKFFAGWSLNADERKQYELDFRKEGSFLHAVLAEFHRQIQQQKMRWRDLDSIQARAMIHDLSQRVAVSYHEGLMRANALNQFVLGSMVSQLQDYIEAIIDGMGSYCFDPCAVELSFGPPPGPPAWQIALSEQRCLSISGKIDRVDGWLNSDASEFWCVVTDYKSGNHHFDPALFAAGIQLQLPIYLNLLFQASQFFALSSATSIRPAGAFYSNIVGKYKPAPDRSQALSSDPEMKERAYQRRGRFDPIALALLDNRPNRKEGTQFKYYVKRDGSLSESKTDAPNGQSFLEFINETTAIVRRLAEQIFVGNIQVDPYQKNNRRACDGCPFGPLCRIDPWTHEFRNIKSSGAGATEPTGTQSNDDE